MNCRCRSFRVADPDALLDHAGSAVSQTSLTARQGPSLSQSETRSTTERRRSITFVQRRRG